jgi:heptosyltransferase-1
VKILIVRVSSLGDVIHNMPMVADILRVHPDASIDWVVEEAYADLVRLNRGVRKVIPFALRRWRKSLLSSATRAEMRAFRRQLRTEQYDLVFDTQGLLKTGAVMGMARLAPGGKRFGLGNGTEGSGYESISRIFHDRSVIVPSRTHAVTRARLVTADALQSTVDTPPDFMLQPPPDGKFSWLPGQSYAVFFHGTSRAAKGWPDANWVRLAHALASSSSPYPILLPWGSEQEHQTAQRLAAQIPLARVLPRLSIAEACLLAHRAALVVGVDTGLTHLAAAFCRPTVELYCDSPRWKTEGNWSDRIINLGDVGDPADPAQAEQAALRLLRAADTRAGQSTCA